MELTVQVYRLTQRFPPEERFGLANQLRRTSVSIPSNIAEGKGRASSGEFVQFVGHARGSTLEVQTQVEIAIMLGFGDENEIHRAQEQAVEVLRIFNASMTTLRARIKSNKPTS